MEISIKLPENQASYSDLVKRGLHAKFKNLHDSYPLESKKLFHRLQDICSQLAHWAPVLAEASYLPIVAFPFTIVYASDELAALETVMTIMMWWGYSWQSLAAA